MEPKSSSHCSVLFLDSGGGWLPDKEGSFILFGEPSISLFSEGQSVTVNSPDKRLRLNRDPLYVLEGYLSEGYIAVGYLSYTYSRFTEHGFNPKRKKGHAPFPDVCFLLFKEGDVISGKIEDLKYLFQIPREESFNYVGEIGERAQRLHSNMGKEEYIEMVRSAKNYIASGDVYQVNLSQRFTLPLEFSPLSYFQNLFDVQPVPYGCYMDFGEFQIISGSMELFLRRKGRKIVTRPIKGTRKRGMTAEEDAILKAELISSEKERAENLMIVDLMRNDLGRVCEYGTVRVNKLFDVESYSTLYQMVSEVEGSLKAGTKIADIISASFPPGSVTGAPKRRALEVIEELEPHSRGPYSGALGIFYPNGDFTLSVAIRILVVKEGMGTLWVGGGIVWDSDPEKEFQETIIKALATKKALGIVE
jgi:aminodeoxychorismate synthase component I